MKKFMFALMIGAVCFNTGLAQSGKQATAQEKKDLSQLILKDDEVKEMIKRSGLNADDLAKNLLVKEINLKRNGQPSFIVGLRNAGDLCDAEGNCLNWIYNKTNSGGYQLLLRIYDVEFSIGKTFTNNLRDLNSVEALSAGQDGITLFKYDGSKYQANKCFTRMINKEEKRKLIAAKCSYRVANLAQSSKKVTTQEKKDLFQLILKNDKEVSEHISEPHWGADKAAKGMSVEKTDLNNDGQPEYIVAMENVFTCGALANCPDFVYRKTGSEYQLLLRTFGRELSWEKTSTNKFLDLRSEGGNTAADGSFTIYKFDGSKYQANKCFNRIYATNKGGKG